MATQRDYDRWMDQHREIKTLEAERDRLRAAITAVEEYADASINSWIEESSPYTRLAVVAARLRAALEPAP